MIQYMYLKYIEKKTIVNNVAKKKKRGFTHYNDWLRALNSEKVELFELHIRRYERNLQYFIIQRGNGFSIVKSFIKKVKRKENLRQNF